MRSPLRLIAVVTLALLGALSIGAPAEAVSDTDRVAEPPAIVVETAPNAPGGTVEADDDGPGIGPVIGGLVILGAVFAIGLSAIRRQRAEGRRSKLPPIG